MPGYILHLLHGQMYLNYAKPDFSVQDYARFRIGLLMPDSNKAAKVKDDRSHFYSIEQNNKIIQIPDLRFFPYSTRIEDPYILGYAAHLYLDRFFFGEYFLKYVHFLDQNGNQTLENDQVAQVFLEKSGCYLSVPELFSEEYLYGDYTMLNCYLIKRFQIEPVQNIPFESPISEVQPQNMEFVLSALDGYLHESTGSTQTKVFTPESLVQAIERYAFGFSQWAEGVMCGR